MTFKFSRTFQPFTPTGEGTRGPRRDLAPDRSTQACAVADAVAHGHRIASCATTFRPLRSSSKAPTPAPGAPQRLAAAFRWNRESTFSVGWTQMGGGRSRAQAPDQLLRRVRVIRTGLSNLATICPTVRRLEHPVRGRIRRHHNGPRGRRGDTTRRLGASYPRDRARARRDRRSPVKLRRTIALPAPRAAPRRAPPGAVTKRANTSSLLELRKTGFNRTGTGTRTSTTPATTHQLRRLFTTPRERRSRS